jgi:hypothetical protein
MTDNKPSQSYLSCTDVARRLGLSRQRFWQLRRDGVFPQPLIDEESGRQFYSAEQVELCLDLRKRNVGMNGKIILFYCPRTPSVISKPTKKKTKAKPMAARSQAIIDSLKALGLVGVTEAQVESAMKELFPIGKTLPDHGELVRNIFLHIQRKDSSDNVGR